MRDFGSLPRWLLVIALSAGGIGQAAAQQSTSASYGDWVLQCQNVAGPPPQKICVIAQVIEVQDKQGKTVPLSRIDVSRTAKTQPFTFIVQVPVNVSLSASLRVLLGGASDPGVAVPFHHCLPVGCFAELDLKEDAIRKLTAATGTAKMTFKTANGQDVTIPISFKGFPQAFKALGQE